MKRILRFDFLSAAKRLMSTNSTHQTIDENVFACKPFESMGLKWDSRLKERENEHVLMFDGRFVD